MNEPSYHLHPKQTFWLLLIPLLATFAAQRLFLHLIGVHHVYPGGYLVHHLFFGIALLLPAAFVLAFGPRRRKTAILSRVMLGCGSAMILDEIVYLVATKASDADYVSPLSLKGALVFIALGIVLIAVIYRTHPD